MLVGLVTHSSASQKTSYGAMKTKTKKTCTYTYIERKSSNASVKLATVPVYVLSWFEFNFGTFFCSILGVSDSCLAILCYVSYFMYFVGWRFVLLGLHVCDFLAMGTQDIHFGVSDSCFAILC